MDIGTDFAGYTLESCICNASGPRTISSEELDSIGRSRSGLIVMKSATLEPRLGNEKPRYLVSDDYAIQSMGLPNHGIDYYTRLSYSLKIKHDKPLIASIAGLCHDDFGDLVGSVNSSYADLLEVNLSCPNIEGKRQIGYDFAECDSLLSDISYLSDKAFGVKLPPYHDRYDVSEIAEIVSRHGASFVTSINSVGNSLIVDHYSESPVTRPNSGLGGLSGPAVKPIALGNVKMLYDSFNEIGSSVSIFGVGGISRGVDVFDFLLAGADAVQVGTEFDKEGPSLFSRLEDELSSFMRFKGYSNIEEFKGKLKSR